LAKSPESDSFVRLILSLLIKIVPTPLDGKYEMPKTFFESPSITVRKCLRQGPKITSKKGLKDNLYAPFSFVKSSECSSMPLDIKKTATDLSTYALTKVDQINKLSASDASHHLEDFKRYLDLSYTISDMARDKWRKSYSIPDYVQVKNILEMTYARDASGGFYEPTTIESERIEAAKAEIRNLIWTVVPKNNAEIEVIRREIDEAMNKRKRAGLKTSA